MAEVKSCGLSIDTLGYTTLKAPASMLKTMTQIMQKR